MTKKYCIGNTHFDPVWLWQWPEAMASIRATFRAALDRMNEDPDFVYSFATPPVFAWIQKTEPDLWQQILARIKEGRWEIGEGWWLQPDCYSAAGESYVRQGLYGQRWLQQNCGKMADTVFNIDSFGHSPMLPQILSGCGIRHYAFTRPESRHVTLDAPLFWWESPDGSRVLTYRAEDCYSKSMSARLNIPSTDDEMVVYGVTDHGGAPTKEAIAQIHRHPNALFSTLTRFFTDHYDCTNVETQEFITGDFGVYANLPKIKALVRRGEYTLLNAEKAAVLAHGTDPASAAPTGQDEHQALTHAWQDVLFHQFHDILGGACILDAYDDAYAGLGRAITTGQEILHTSLQRMTARYAMPGAGWNLAIWNLHDTDYDGYLEAEVQWLHEYDWYTGGITLTDRDGKSIPCQIIREKSVIPGFRSRFLFRGYIPAMGFQLYHVEKTATPVPALPKKTTPTTLKTDALTITFQDGCIHSVTDAEGHTLAKELFVPALLQDDGDTWAFNIADYGTPLSWTHTGMTVEEDGPYRTVLRSRFQYGLSELVLYYRIYHDQRAIEVRWVCHWNDRHKAVKLLCTTASDTHLAAVPYGTAARGETAHDVPLGLWVQTKEYTLLSKDSFAYSLRDGQLGVTLFRSPIAGDLRISEIDPEADYDILSTGKNEGQLRLCFDKYTPHEAWEMADHFADPPIVIEEAWHDGQPAPTSFPCTIEADGTALTVVKQAEDGAGLILRLVEQNGRGDTVCLHLIGKTYPVTMKPYEIKTLLYTDATITEVSMLEK